MPSLVGTLGMVLALAAPSLLAAQTAPQQGRMGPPGDPYGGMPSRQWPGRPGLQPRGAGQPPPGRVLPAAYGAEVPQPDPSAKTAGLGDPQPPDGPPPGTQGAPSRSLALPGPGAALALPRQGSTGGGRRAARSDLPSAVTVVGSLAVVLGLFFVVAWALRRAAPGESAALPGEVVEVLGRKAVAGRQQLQLLRCGKKLLLVSLTPEDAATLTEITDPEEVDRLVGLCRQAQPGSATATFRQAFQRFSTDPTEGRDD